MQARPAPPWSVARWFNSDALALADLRGRPVYLHAFQMLCPGCVQHAIPQSLKVADAFAGSDLAIVGLHTVFEHHAVTGPDALAAYLHENRIRYPVAVDAHVPGDPIPATMRAYAMQGTPTAVLIDRAGRLRLQHFGGLDDLRLGAQLGTLLAEPAD